MEPEAYIISGALFKMPETERFFFFFANSTKPYDLVNSLPGPLPQPWRDHTQMTRVWGLGGFN